MNMSIVANMAGKMVAGIVHQGLTNGLTSQPLSVRVGYTVQVYTHSVMNKVCVLFYIK